MGEFNIILKPCPFCGGEARIFVGYGVKVRCIQCGAESKKLQDEEKPGEKEKYTVPAVSYPNSAVEESIRLWNRRAGESGREGK